MPLSEHKRKELLRKCQLIFYGLPIGKNAPHDTPIIGNQTLAQVVVNRVESISKEPDEFKFMIDSIMKMLAATKDQTVRKVKLDLPTSGLTDSKGFLIPKSKKL